MKFKKLLFTLIIAVSFTAYKKDEEAALAQVKAENLTFNPLQDF